MTKQEADQQRKIIGNWQKAMNAELERLDWPLCVVPKPSKLWSIYPIHGSELVATTTKRPTKPKRRRSTK